MVDFLGGPICWGDLHRKDNWGDLKVWGDLILLGGPKTPLYTMSCDVTDPQYDSKFPKNAKKNLIK